MRVTSTNKRLKLVILILTGLTLLYQIAGINASATTVDVLDGAVSITDSANSNSVSNGRVTITANGSLFSKKTNNITITNETSEKAQLSFDYSADKANSFKIADADAGPSGSYNITLEASESLSITLVSNSGFSNTTATLVLSNFSLTAVAAESDVTFQYDSSFGSITVAGAATTNGSVVKISGETGAALVATSNSSKFLGWIDGYGRILSTAASYTLKPATAMTVKAVFAKEGGTLWFGVGAVTSKTVGSGLLGLSKIYYYEAGVSYLFDDLNAAAAAAAASANKAVVLMNSGTLPAGDYTIPAGVTLLIPYDSANTLYTTQVKNTTSTYVKPTAYRTLTMADGANLSIDGSMSLSALQQCAQGSKANGGSPTGPVSFVQMQKGSTITINDGGALYAYGYITGSGTVTANSGATVYEMFQFMDFRGGTQSTDMENRVFPFSQYYVQNIEVSLTLYAGATEYAYTTIYMSSADFGMAVPFIGPGQYLFKMSNGYATKKYDGAADRLLIDSYGDVSLSSIMLDFGTASINSSEYDFPLGSNITVTLHSDTTASIDQAMCLLPGSEIIIEKDVTCTISKNIFAYDLDEWDNFTFGASSVNSPCKPITYAPGKTYTRTEADLKDAMIKVNGTVSCDSEKGGYIYTTAGGANICSDGGGQITASAGTQSVTYQLVQGTGYTGITINPAMLKNADGSYTGSGNSSTNPNTYTYTNGKWVCKTHTEVTDAAVAPTCTETGLTEGKHCSVCGTVTVAQQIVAALGHTEVIDAAVVPTCTETGLTEGKHCSVCGEVTVVQEEVAALGHNYEAEVTPPTCTDGGCTTYTCTGCGDTYDEDTAATGHSYTSEITTAATCTTDGLRTYTCSNCSDSYTEVIAAGHTYEGSSVICKVCGLFEFYASNVHLGNSLDMMFAFPAAAFDADADLGGYYVKAVRTYANGTPEEIVFQANTWSATTINNVKYYVVIYKGFAAKEMCDSISLTVCRNTTGEEVALSTVWEDSIQRYAMRMLNDHSGNEKLRTLIVDMLNYGAACQTEFKYNTGSLANAGLSDEQEGWATETVTWSTELPSGNDSYGANLIVDSNIRFVISGVNDNLPYTFVNHWDVPRGGDLLYDAEGQYYYVSKLFVADARQVITITMGEINWTDSVEAYCKRMVDGDNDANGVFTAFMKFSNSAYEYLHDEGARV